VAQRERRYAVWGGLEVDGDDPLATIGPSGAMERPVMTSRRSAETSTNSPTVVCRVPSGVSTSVRRVPPARRSVSALDAAAPRGANHRTDIRTSDPTSDSYVGFVRRTRITAWGGAGSVRVVGVVQPVTA